MIVWDVQRAASGETLQGHAGEITGLAISRDGGTLYTSGVDGNVLVWDLTGNRRLGRAVAIGRGATDAVPGSRLPVSATSPDGRVLALGLGDGTISLVDARTLRTRSSFRVAPRGPVRTLAYVPGSRLLVVGGDDGFLALVDPRRETIVRPLRGHLGTLRSTSISADGRVMASAAGFGEDIRIWALPSGRAAARPRGKLAELTGDGEPALSPDGRTLAVLGPGLDIEIVRCAHGAAPRVAAEPRPGALRRALHARRPLPRGLGRQGLGAAVVDCDLATRRPGAARAERRGLLACREPGQPHPGHGQHGRDDCGSSTCARNGRSAPRCPACPAVRWLPLFTPTAPTCSPSPTPGARTAGTSARPHGRGRPAPWPAAR